jgi:hypothetical protein
MAAQLRRTETVQRIQKHKVKRFGGSDDEIEEGSQGNKTVRGGNSGIMSLGAFAFISNHWMGRTCRCL